MGITEAAFHAGLVRGSQLRDHDLTNRLNVNKQVERTLRDLSALMRRVNSLVNRYHYVAEIAELPDEDYSDARGLLVRGRYPGAGAIMLVPQVAATGVMEYDVVFPGVELPLRSKRLSVAEALEVVGEFVALSYDAKRVLRRRIGHLAIVATAMLSCVLWYAVIVEALTPDPVSSRAGLGGEASGLRGDGLRAPAPLY